MRAFRDVGDAMRRKRLAERKVCRFEARVKGFVRAFESIRPMPSFGSICLVELASGGGRADLDGGLRAWSYFSPAQHE
jgi:hypothetical protein